MKKRHHTVPKCYLENFAAEDGFVWVLDTKDNIFKIKPENILVENHFYTVTLKNGDKSLLVEDTLANIEGAYTTIFRDKLSKDEFLTVNERATVAIFIAALFLRTQPYREGTRNMFQRLKNSMEEWKKQFETIPRDKRMASVMPSNGESITIEEVTDHLENFKEQHSISVLTQLPEVAQIIFDMKWSIWKSQGTKFVTSDDPVVLLRPEAIKKYGARAIGSQPGLLYKDVELTLPLSKDRLLLAGWILKKDSYISVENELVDSMNHRTITGSSKKVVTSLEAQAIVIKEKYYQSSQSESK